MVFRLLCFWAACLFECGFVCFGYGDVCCVWFDLLGGDLLFIVGFACLFVCGGFGLPGFCVCVGDFLRMVV